MLVELCRDQRPGILPSLQPLKLSYFTNGIELWEKKKKIGKERKCLWKREKKEICEFPRVTEACLPVAVANWTGFVPHTVSQPRWRIYRVLPIMHFLSSTGVDVNLPLFFWHPPFLFANGILKCLSSWLVFIPSTHTHTHKSTSSHTHSCACRSSIRNGINYNTCID